MPTAVEHTFEPVLSFLKIEDAALNMADRNANAFFVDIETDHKGNSDIASTSDFFKVQGDALTGVAGVAVKVEDLIYKRTDGGDFTTIGSATGGAGAGKLLDAFFNLDETFATLGEDLKALGTDFLKLQGGADETADHKHKDEEAVVSDITNISKLLTGDRSLSAQVNELLRMIPNSDNSIYKELSGELQKVSNALGGNGGLATEFGLLLPAVKNAFGSGGGAGFPQDLRDALSGIGQNFATIDSAFVGANDAAGQLIGLLLPAVQKA